MSASICLRLCAAPGSRHTITGFICVKARIKSGGRNWENVKKKEKEKRGRNRAFHLGVSLPSPRVLANCCSNPVSTFAHSVTGCCGVRSCSQIVVRVSRFTRAAPSSPPVCLCASKCRDAKRDTERGGTPGSGQEAAGGDDVWPTHKQAPRGRCGSMVHYGD